MNVTDCIITDEISGWYFWLWFFGTKAFKIRLEKTVVGSWFSEYFRELTEPTVLIQFYVGVFWDIGKIRGSFSSELCGHGHEFNEYGVSRKTWRGHGVKRVSMGLSTELWLCCSILYFQDHIIGHRLLRNNRTTRYRL